MPRMRTAETREPDAVSLPLDRPSDESRSTQVQAVHSLECSDSELQDLCNGIVPENLRRQCAVHLMPLGEWVAHCRK